MTDHFSAGSPVHRPDLRGGVAHITGLRPGSKCHEPMPPAERRGWRQFLALFCGSAVISLALIYVAVAFFLDDAKWVLP